MLCYWNFWFAKMRVVSYKVTETEKNTAIFSRIRGNIKLILSSFFWYFAKMKK